MKQISIHIKPLWTEEEGCSDLSLELILIETDHTLLTTEVDNLHVL